jgi:hypothetical protein
VYVTRRTVNQQDARQSHDTRGKFLLQNEVLDFLDRLLIRYYLRLILGFTHLLDILLHVVISLQVILDIFLLDHEAGFDVFRILEKIGYFLLDRDFGLLTKLPVPTETDGRCSIRSFEFIHVRGKPRVIEVQVRDGWVGIVSRGGLLSRLRVINKQRETTEDKSLDFHHIFRVDPDYRSEGDRIHQSTFVGGSKDTGVIAL